MLAKSLQNGEIKKHDEQVNIRLHGNDIQAALSSGFIILHVLVRA